MYVTEDPTTDTEQVIVMDMPRHRAKKLVEKWEDAETQATLGQFLIWEEYEEVSPGLIHHEEINRANP